VWIKRLNLQLGLHGLPSGIARGHDARQCVTDLNLDISNLLAVFAAIYTVLLRAFFRTSSDVVFGNHIGGLEFGDFIVQLIIFIGVKLAWPEGIEQNEPNRAQHLDGSPAVPSQECTVTILTRGWCRQGLTGVKVGDTCFVCGAADVRFLHWRSGFDLAILRQHLYGAIYSWDSNRIMICLLANARWEMQQSGPCRHPSPLQTRQNEMLLPVLHHLLLFATLLSNVPSSLR